MPLASVSAAPAASATASAPRRPLELPPRLRGPVEPDDHPKVQADTAGICAQLSAGRHSAFGAMAVFTKRWLQLSWLYEQGDADGVCQIAQLVRAAAKYPDGSCTAAHVERFDNHCVNWRQPPSVAN